MKNIQISLSILLLALTAACGDDDTDPPPPDPDMDASPADPEPRGAENPPTLGAQIDRMGRPAINTALNHAFEADADLKGEQKDAYNQAGPEDWDEFVGAFATSLAILDGLDTNCGNQLLANGENPAGRYAMLAGILADDQLYVNTASGTCGVYLGVEAELVGAVGPGVGGCGGRTPADDVIERSYSVLAAGALGGIDDLITADDGDQTTTFPFLGPPTL